MEPTDHTTEYEKLLGQWLNGSLKPRPAKRPDGFPTRHDVNFYTTAETAIMAAMSAVEISGASLALTDAVNLLSQARDRVADHVEGKTE